MNRNGIRNDGGIGRGAWLVVLGVTLARIVYLIFICPYELAADEAQYWDWSRPEHLSLSYYSKGPGIAWLIAASTRIWGDAEWAIRLPAAVSMGIAMVAVAALAGRMGGGRAAFAAALGFCCIPAYHATAILMTIDAPYVACWALAALAAWSIRERGGLGGWVALAVCLGIGFLFKYTILLLVPGLLIWGWLERGNRGTDGPNHRPLLAAVGGTALAAGLFALIISPVLIWNARHGWPTVAHLLGHVGAAGGDLPVGASPRPYEARWTLEFIGTQIGLVGPMLALMVMAVIRAWKERAENAAGWRASRFALATALPILLFYFGVSFTSDVEGNWPIAGYTTLLVPVALAVSSGFFRAVWHWSIGYGAVAFLALFSLQWLDRVPTLTDAIPYHRISEHRAYAQRIAAAMDEPDQFFVADQYTRAALLAYYLPDRPVVRSATSFLGGRKSSYDFFPDTTLDDPSLLGRPAVLVGATPEKWGRAFRFDSIEAVVPEEPKRPSVYLGTNFGGPTTP